jgi:diadenylate cyclase
MINLLAVRATGIGEAFSNLFGDVKLAFSEFSLIDAIDILVLTLLFFFAFRFFRSRKAGALIIGVFICLVILVGAWALGLEGTSAIFQGIFKIGALAIVIIFQPEIRDLLERIGNGSLSSLMSFGEQKKKQQLYYKAVENICIAVSDLSRSKTGALIVLSRTTDTDDVIETGIKINADTNSFLLRNIFFNKAPLHDGAVVIDNARIVAAGCLLPLTRRQDIDGDLGTRHRAAIGMSEISDAIIVVVSEETGIISIASDCMLTRNYTPDTLRSFLLKTWVRDKSEKRNQNISES